jgi:hypothetical protein
VAGGFGSKVAPLYARTRAGGAATDSAPPPGPAAAEADERADCPARHCWVTSPVDGGAPRPGLLLEWRRGQHGWEGRVAYAAQLRARRWGAVEEWLPAEAVASVERTTPPSGQPRPDLDRGT